MSPSALTTVYTIDPVVSRFTVRVFATGLLSSFGHSPTIAIRDFSGEARFSPDAPDEAALVLRIRAKSLAVTDDISDKDRRELERTMNEQVLESARYPEIVFESSKASLNRAGDHQYFVNMVGSLTLHGITNNQAVSAQIALTGDLLRGHGEFSVLQTAYGIKPVSVAGGSLKVKDEVKCAFDIVARKKVDNK